MDAVVITTQPRRPRAGNRLPQVKGLVAKRSKNEKGAYSSIPSTIPKMEVVPRKAGPKSKNSVTPKTKVEAGSLVLQNDQRQVPTSPVAVRIESPEPSLPEAAEVLEQKMKLWKNPKVKVKREPIELTKDTVIARISAAGISFDPFHIDFPRADRDVEVTREFMSATWGGSPQETFPTISPENLARHGLSDFMYLPTGYQPIAPKIPGAPGLWLNIGGRGDEWNRGIKRVFTKVSDKTPAKWLYQGQYEIKLAKCLTREEWSRQSVKVRETWAEQLVVKRWGRRCQAVIYARMHWGRPPTEDEIDQICARGDNSTITKEDISLSLTRGETNMPVYTMKCVGYDAAFQREIAEKAPLYVPRPRKPRCSGGGNKRNAGDSEPPEPKGRKPTKRQKLERDVINVDLLGSQEEEPDYRSRGTKSRPAKRP
ncbi:hypothetical protein DFP72DRAFT_932875 [Ephemerocybe angulata]|uniref:DUF6697 domain-containing protein n=1 Tax=Ephemerocybe angulata TaxID=980116 RepID=A0A8H6HAT5_9AGAR|nr:hypothetical protein DFP72DRAFT_932875 [Tulosesus angulatus]